MAAVMDPLHPDSFNHRTEALANGLTLHFVDQLPNPYVLNKTPTLLLVHGFPEIWYEWRYQIGPWVRRGWRVIAVDLPGYGESDKPDDIDSYTAVSMSSNLNALLEVLKLDRIVLVAHDWGSAFARKYSQRWPQKLQAIVSVSIPYRPPLPAGITGQQLVGMLPETMGYWHYVMTDKAASDIQSNLQKYFDICYRSMDNRIELWRKGELEAKLLGEDVSPSDILTDKEKEYYVSNYQKGGVAKPMLAYRALDAQMAQEKDLDLKATLPASLPVLLLAPDGCPHCSEADVASTARFVPSLEVIRVRAFHYVLSEKKGEVAETLGDWIEGKLKQAQTGAEK